jgi:hypothetical protein
MVVVGTGGLAISRGPLLVGVSAGQVDQVGEHGAKVAVPSDHLGRSAP